MAQAERNVEMKEIRRIENLVAVKEGFEDIEGSEKFQSNLNEEEVFVCLSLLDEINLHLRLRIF